MLIAAAKQQQQQQQQGRIRETFLIVVAYSRQNKLTLQSFIENEYKNWVQTHRKRGLETITRIGIHSQLNG